MYKFPGRLKIFNPPRTTLFLTPKNRGRGVEYYITTYATIKNLTHFKRFKTKIFIFENFPKISIEMNFTHPFYPIFIPNTLCWLSQNLPQICTASAKVYVCGILRQMQYRFAVNFGTLSMWTKKHTSQGSQRVQIYK